GLQPCFDFFRGLPSRN
ncbi:putative outer membrane protein, partial [Escherichia coli EC1846]